MSATELSPRPELASTSVTRPATVPEAIAAGHSRPCAENPFLWSSNLWEAFNLGPYLHGRGIAPGDFRKSRGSTYMGSPHDLFKIVRKGRLARY